MQLFLGFLALVCSFAMFWQAIWSWRTGTYYHRFRSVNRAQRPVIFWLWIGARVYLGLLVGFIAYRLLRGH